MNFKGIDICCPHCRAELDRPRENALVCRGCRREFPILLGIPDLRIFPDPYIGIEEDRAKAARLGERFNDFDFQGFVDFYYANTSVVPPQHARLYKRGLLAAPARAENWLACWEAEGTLRGEELLDVGCGTAPLLSVANRFRTRVGVDIAFRWLVVAKKRLAETGLDLPLICACAEALPFPDKIFDHAVADSTIEHLQDQRKGLAEVRRVLRPGGRLMLSTPNRFSVGPDPHTGVWAGTWLPERWTAALVRRAGGIPPVRQLLSVLALRNLLGDARFHNVRISLPGIPPKQRAQFSPLLRTLTAVYDLLRRLPVSRHLLYLIGPLLQATATRKE